MFPSVSLYTSSHFFLPTSTCLTKNEFNFPNCFFKRPSCPMPKNLCIFHHGQKYLRNVDSWAISNALISELSGTQLLTSTPIVNSTIDSNAIAKISPYMNETCSIMHIVYEKNKLRELQYICIHSQIREAINCGVSKNKSTMNKYSKRLKDSLLELPRAWGIKL